MSICKGEDVVLHAFHTETSISYKLKSQVSITEESWCELTAADFHLTLPPERIAIYGDGEWRFSMLTAIRNAVRSSHSLCAYAYSKIKVILLHK